MLILGQKSYFLGPTILKIPQPAYISEKLSAIMALQIITKENKTKKYI